MNKKNLLIIVCASMLTMAVPAKAANMVMELGVAEQIDEQMPQLSVDGNTVNVQGAAGMTLEVVSLTGRAVATYRIEGPAQRIELNLPKGCYILKVGKVARKVTVR
ncbi:MAG: T9SS type A sorting domain-containing protein [Prevotella sp.]|jgi:hypothetical protein|nr:T9SS type A sorting domain-containing protein [Prevotella sp.]